MTTLSRPLQYHCPPRTEQGYSLVELLVAMAVSGIVIAGTYAGYTFFAQQQQVLLAQTEVDRNALRSIDLIASDIRMAGFKDYFNPNVMSSGQPIVITTESPGDIRLVYDEYDASGTLFRALIRYSLVPYTPAGGVTRNRLVREWRRCVNPAAFCDLASTTIIQGLATGEPMLDWVTSFTVKGLNPRASGSFSGQYQTVEVTFSVQSPKKIEGTPRIITKNFSFLTRAKNVSIVP